MRTEERRIVEVACAAILCVCSSKVQNNEEEKGSVASRLCLFYQLRLEMRKERERERRRAEESCCSSNSALQVEGKRA